MNQTPDETAGTSGSSGQGPRVSTAQVRDVNRLRRSRTDRRIAGVAGGLARHLDIDPTVVRVLLVVLAFFGGAGLLIYGAVWLFVPEDGSDHAPIGTSAETRTAVLVIAGVLAALLLLGNGWWLGFNPGWPPPVLPIAVIALVVWLVLRHRRPAGPAPHPYAGPQPYSAAQPYSGGQPSGPAGYPPPQPPTEAMPARPPRPRNLLGVTLAVVLLTLGALAVVELAGTPMPWAVYPAAALTVIGAGLVTGAFVGRTTGLTFFGLLATAVLAVAVWTPQLRFADEVRHPTTAAQVQDDYHYTAGRVHLDLTDVSDPQNLDGRVLDVRVFAGDVVVELPADGLDVDVVSRARAGQLVMLGHMVEGPNVVNHESTPDTGAPDLRINVDLGFGHARVSTS